VAFVDIQNSYESSSADASRCQGCLALEGSLDGSQPSFHSIILKACLGTLCSCVSWNTSMFSFARPNEIRESVMGKEMPRTQDSGCDSMTAMARFVAKSDCTGTTICVSGSCDCLSVSISMGAAVDGMSMMSSSIFRSSRLAPGPKVGGVLPFWIAG